MPSGCFAFFTRHMRKGSALTNVFRSSSQLFVTDAGDPGSAHCWDTSVAARHSLRVTGSDAPAFIYNSDTFIDL